MGNFSDVYQRVFRPASHEGQKNSGRSSGMIWAKVISHSRSCRSMWFDVVCVFDFGFIISLPGMIANWHQLIYSTFQLGWNNQPDHCAVFSPVVPRSSRKMSLTLKVHAREVHSTGTDCSLWAYTSFVILRKDPEHKSAPNLRRSMGESGNTQFGCRDSLHFPCDEKHSVLPSATTICGPG
jgi:hypothetical protein